MMKDSLKRADDIIRGLLEFSRATELQTRPEDINSILEGSLALVQHKTRLQEIEIIKEFKEGLPRILADRNKLEQVFVNLILNAIDAMPKGGKLFVRSCLVQLVEHDEKVGRKATDSFHSGEKVAAVEIEDTGSGISKENIDRIFDPFFTTKGRTEGTGLGLSISKSIVQMHRGLMRVESPQDKGAKFTIQLKLAEGC
jgi:signal transduction histidine kinase